jgi:hypothetical protein
MGAQGPAGPHGGAGPPGPPGQLPSIEQVMPWLHLIFDAWEDYKKTREREAAEREALEVAFRMSEEFDDDGHKKKKKKHKHKHKHKDKRKENDDSEE